MLSLTIAPCPNIDTVIQDDDQQAAIKPHSSVRWFVNPSPLETFLLNPLQVIMKTFTALASMLIALPAVLGILTVDTPFVPLLNSNMYPW